MWQPQSIRFHLAAVFLLFFALVLVLGSFSIWRLANFNLLSADVAEIWLPTTRALGDLNNYTSDFRAFEGSALLSSGPAEAAATERQMAELDRTIADGRAQLRAYPPRCSGGWSLRPVQGALERLPGHRQPDAGVLPATDRKDDAQQSMAARRARPMTRPATRSASSPTRPSPARRPRATGSRPPIAAFWLIPLAIVIAASWSSRRWFISAARSRRRSSTSPTGCAGSPPTTPTSLSPRPAAGRNRRNGAGDRRVSQ